MLQYPFAIVVAGKSAAAALAPYADVAVAAPAFANAVQHRHAPPIDRLPEPALTTPALHQHEYYHQQQQQSSFPTEEVATPTSYQPTNLPDPTIPTPAQQHSLQIEPRASANALPAAGSSTQPPRPPPQEPSAASSHDADAARLAVKLQAAQAELNKQTADATAALDMLKAELARERGVSDGLREKVVAASTPQRVPPPASTSNTLEGMTEELAAALIAAASAEATTNRLKREMAITNDALEQSKAEVVKLNAKLTTDTAALAKTIEDYKTMATLAKSQTSSSTTGVSVGGGGSRTPPQSPVRFNKSRLPVRSPTKRSDGGGGGGIQAQQLQLQQRQLQLAAYNAVEAERRAKMAAMRRAEIAEHNCTERTAEVVALESQLSTLQYRLAEAGSAAVVMATASAAASTRSAAEVADAHRELQSRLEQSELRADASDGKAKVANTRYLA